MFTIMSWWGSNVIVSFSVKNKFGIPLSIELLFLDDSDTVVDEEVIHDILEANPNICLLAKDVEGTLRVIKCFQVYPRLC